ncbi:Heat induced stress protein YflT [Bacillus sp. OV322]|uniref:general stress protein n=1 Tax=Bacillus sp. OV322 TaxID=1882764 RepID=UPI0008E6D10E|nr:general stress protein [Bacillus sp. OV322]SFC87043.1 Heat induced stress protein YflT [Bacillus sp. OV322]
MDKRVVGVYDNGEDAIRAVEDLKRQGYDRDDISVIAKDRDDVDMVNESTGTNTEEGMAAGAATGGILGGAAGLLAGVGALAIPGIGPILAAGPIVATLTGAAVGAGTGGLAGALIGMGIPEDEADRYETDVKSGKLLVLVDPKAKRSNSGLTEKYDTDPVHPDRNDQRAGFDQTVDDVNSGAKRY